MPLERGTRLGPYAIVAPIGAGGMGEVYKATDTRLERTVAIKVLPAHVASDPERKQRFEREAKTVAALSHPHICPVFDVGREGEIDFLVMEYLEGETLADRLTKGALPLDQALRYAIEIADALDKAHRQGVTHRDLKPANIMLTKAGAKLLDFGLAKLKPTGPQSDASTKLADALTEQGTILGTFQYMAPEQLEGKDADARSDIWAFGCVVYEMVTGQKAFEGKSQASLIAAILHKEPTALSSVVPLFPPGLDYVVQTCLDKDPDDRWQSARDLLRDLKRIDAGDVRVNLEAALQEDAAASPSDANLLQRVASRIPWLVAAVLGVVVFGLLFRETTPGVIVPVTRRFALDLPWKNMPNWGDFRVRISPQGTHLAYPGSNENRTTIYLRSFDSLEAVTLVSPSADPWNLAFSPDGERLAFFTGTQLHTVSIHGGQPEPLFDVQFNPSNGSLSWGSDGTILVSGKEGLTRVPTSGAEPEFVAAAGEGELYRDQFHLPDGDHALVSIFHPPSVSRLAVVNLATGTVRELAFQGREPIYSPTGHVLFRQNGELFAFRFDPDSLDAGEEAVAIAASVAFGPRLSQDGTLVYVAQRVAGSAGLVWVDRQGIATPIAGERSDYTHIDLSAEGGRALLNITQEIYASDLNRGSRGLVSTDTHIRFAGFPLWHPDGERATFAQDGAVVTRMADGSGQEEVLLQSGVAVDAVPTSWSPDGEYLAFFDVQSDVWMLPVDGNAELFLSGPANERSARFSPDGTAVAYVSDESGEFQVYVTPFPGPGARIPVSIDGGLSPIWSADGEELYFRQGSKVMSAKVALSPGIEVLLPELLFDGPYTLDLSGHQRYDVGPDGRFLMVENSEDFRVVVVEGFFEELRRLVPTN